MSRGPSGWHWKDKVRLGTPLAKAFEQFNWCEIADEKDDPALPSRRLHKLIADVKTRCRKEKLPEVKRVLLTTVRSLEAELEKHETTERNVSPRARN